MFFCFWYRPIWSGLLGLSISMEPDFPLTIDRLPSFTEFFSYGHLNLIELWNNFNRTWWTNKIRSSTEFYLVLLIEKKEIEEIKEDVQFQLIAEYLPSFRIFKQLLWGESNRNPITWWHYPILTSLT